MEDKNEDKLIINHPRFKQLAYLRDKDIIRVTMQVDHEQDYRSWESKLEKITDLDDEVILLPKAYTYARKAICGSSGTINVLLPSRRSTSITTRISWPTNSKTDASWAATLMSPKSGTCSTRW